MSDFRDAVAAIVARHASEASEEILQLCARQTAMALMPGDGPEGEPRRVAVHFPVAGDGFATVKPACGSTSSPLTMYCQYPPGEVTCQGCMHTGAWKAAAR